MPTYIAHHGILGQKWGVRRYQNADGSLTPEGKKRYYATRLSKNEIEKARKKYSVDEADDAFYNKHGDIYKAYHKIAMNLANDGYGPLHIGQILDIYDTASVPYLLSDGIKYKDNGDWYFEPDEKLYDERLPQMRIIDAEDERRVKHSETSYAYIAHHGIKGQKWYHRRYQNSDGSLTPLGRIRYGVGQARDTFEVGASSYKKRLSKHVTKALDSDKLGRFQQGSSYKTRHAINRVRSSLKERLDPSYARKSESAYSDYLSKKKRRFDSFKAKVGMHAYTESVLRSKHRNSGSDYLHMTSSKFFGYNGSISSMTLDQLREAARYNLP